MAKSASWSLILNQAVADQASVEVPTPRYDPALADPSSVELAIGNDVVTVPDKATVVFNGETATVTNLTGAEWASGELVYIYVEAKSLSSADGGVDEALAAMQEQIDANATAISTLQTDVGALQTDVGALQTDVGDLQARVAALETPVAQKGR